MKTYIYIGIATLLLAITLPLKAQDKYNLKFRYNDDRGTLVSSLVLHDNSIYLADVASDSVPNNRTEGYLAKFSLTGDKLWENTYGFNYGDTVSQPAYGIMLKTIDNGLLLSGAGNNRDAFLTKINPQTGDTLWYKLFSPPGNPDQYQTSALCELPNGDIVMGLNCYNFDRVAVIRTDPNGNEIWRREYYTQSTVTPKFSLHNIAERQGELLVFGEMGTSNTTPWALQVRNTVLMVLDSLGNIVDDQLFPESFKMGFNMELLYTMEGNVACIGYWAERFPNTTFKSQVSFFEVDTNYNVQNRRNYGIPDQSLQAHSFIRLRDGNYLVAGGTRLPDSTDILGWLLCLSPQGDSLWSQYYRNFQGPGYVDHYLYDLAQLPNGDIVACGYLFDRATSSPTLGHWGWLLRTDSVGCLVPGCNPNIGTSATANPPPRMVCYPNPARGYLHVQATLTEPEAQGSRFRLLDLQGQELRRWSAPAGSGTTSVSLDDLPAGMYLLQLYDASSGRVLQSEKVVLVRD